MHRQLIPSFALVAMVTGFLSMLYAPSAEAKVICLKEDPITNECLIEALAPGSPSGESSDRPGDSGSSGSRTDSVSDRSQHSGLGNPCLYEPIIRGADHARFENPEPVACSLDGMPWSNRWQCYIAPAAPQPPASDAVWEGRDPSDGGAIYDCHDTVGDFIGSVWLANPPEAAADGPTPAEVAQRAVESMNLQAISIGSSIEPGEVGIVGVPVWLWVSDPAESTFGPNTRTATAGGVSVTARAHVDRIEWDMGDGESITCHTPGTPWAASHGLDPSPDCGHTYQRESGAQPNSAFRVTATSYWVVDWEGAGQSGTLTLAGLVAETEVTIGEAQLLVQ